MKTHWNIQTSGWIVQRWDLNGQSHYEYEAVRAIESRRSLLGCVICTGVTALPQMRGGAILTHGPYRGDTAAAHQYKTGGSQYAS